MENVAEQLEICSDRIINCTLL